MKANLEGMDVTNPSLCAELILHWAIFGAGLLFPLSRSFVAKQARVFFAICHMMFLDTSFQVCLSVHKACLCEANHGEGVISDDLPHEVFPTYGWTVRTT